MLEYNEITLRKYILVDGEPFEVLDSHVFRKQQRKPVNQTKLKSLLTGRIMERSFHQSEKAEEAELTYSKVKYLYSHKGEHWFCEEKDAAKRFKLEDSLVGSKVKFMKPNSMADAVSFNEKIIGLEIPIKLELKVTEAPPAVKGDTAKGGNKVITLETGITINAPLFINPGDIVRINTETGEYVERVGGF
jgi:elongation factor P